jgi:cell division protein FtsL
MSEPFEYAIRKDVRNNPIVREVDEARQRELWKLVGMAGVIVVVLLFFAWPHFELIRNGYQIEQLKQERSAQEQLTRKLRLEVESLKSPKRIEALAMERLHLVSPGQGEAIVLERIVQAEPPAQSLVARR